MLDLKETMKKSRSFPYYAALLEFTECSRAPGSNPGLVDIKSFPQLFPLDYDDKRNARNYTFILGSSLVGLSHLHSRQISICLTMMVINFPLLEEGKELCSFFNSHMFQKSSCALLCFMFGCA